MNDGAIVVKRRRLTLTSTSWRILKVLRNASSCWSFTLPPPLPWFHFLRGPISQQKESSAWILMRCLCLLSPLYCHQHKPHWLSLSFFLSPTQTYFPRLIWVWHFLTTIITFHDQTCECSSNGTVHTYLGVYCQTFKHRTGKWKY